MYKNRIITDRLKKLVKDFPVVVLVGARQVGKSTALTHIFPDFAHITFDPVIDIGYSRNEPDLFLDNNPSPVIFDEIQYAPELVSAIKRRVDKSRKSGQYILTGSQQWAVMKNISEALTGRAVILQLEGFSVAEIAQQLPDKNWLDRWLNGDDFTGDFRRLNIGRTLYEQLWRGFLPDADRLDADSVIALHRSYIQTYVERDVRQLLDTDKWQTFGKFMQMLSALSSQEVNYLRFGKDLDISAQTVKRWLSVLEGTFQWFSIPAYSGNSLKRVRNKPKGYMSDTGLICSLNMVSSHKALGGNPAIGAIFETAVVNELRKLSRALPMPPQFHHWRSAGGAEVDLVLERDGLLYPIEIKLTSNPTKKHTSGITAFRKAYPELKIARGLVICPCERFVKISEEDYAMLWDCC